MAEKPKWGATDPTQYHVMRPAWVDSDWPDKQAAESRRNELNCAHRDVLTLLELAKASSKAVNMLVDTIEDQDKLIPTLRKIYDCLQPALAKVNREHFQS